MKSQFIKIGDPQEKDTIPNHLAVMSGWVPQQPGAPGAPGGQPLEKPLMPGQQQYSGRVSIVDQDTVEQRALPLRWESPQQPQPPQLQQSAQPLVWDNRSQGQVPNPPVQAFMNGPVSPRESGVTPFAQLYPDGPLSQGLQPPAMPQPFYPQQQGPVTNVPMMPMMPMPSYPVLYPNQQGGMPPYMMEPPLPPRGKRRKKKRRFPIWARILVGFMLFLVLLTGAGFAYYQIYFAKAVQDSTGIQAAREKGETNPNQGRNGDILSGGRINILLLGSDTDQKFGTSAGGDSVYLAQTDIVVSIDPSSGSVAMLSIPRDFYINIPNFGMGKLDEAFEHGYSYGQGGFLGAVALSRLTIEQDFGIPIDYYAWVGLDGFIKVIDTVGGVDVDVLHPITDDAYPDDVGNTTGDIYAYKRLYIPPGPQHLDGATALEYVRSRHADLVGDFGRSARQQQVLSALKTKLVNPGIVSQLPQLATDLDGSVKTDMQLTDVLKLMNFARTVDPNKIQHIVLDPPYSSATTLPSGESIVQPNCTAIIPIIAQVFQLGNKAQCNITANSVSTNSTLATSQTPTTTQSASAGFGANTTALQGVGQFASMTTMSLGGGVDNLFGMHSLLDLMFTVVFESPVAMQV